MNKTILATNQNSEWSFRRKPESRTRLRVGITWVQTFTWMTMVLLVVIFLTWQPPLSLAADTVEKKKDLSAVNWDTAEEEKDTAAGDKVENNLSTTSWEDEESDPKEDAENAAADQKREDEYRVIEKQERGVQIAGFFIFCMYLLGMFLTAYFTRNRKLAVNYSPELLILLHGLWPLQWLLLPFFGQKVR